MFDIITDSACDLTPETAATLNIEIIPFYVSLDGEHYRKEGKEIAVRDFYQFMVDNPAAYPKTSLPSLEDFETAFRAHAEAGRPVLCICFTSKMSGCVGSARNARELVLEDFPDAKIEVIDSTAATVTESIVVENAVAMRDAGCTLDEAVTWLEAEKITNQIFFTVGNLDYLIKGGRIGKVTGRAANILGIKPSLAIIDGELKVVKKYRGSLPICVGKYITDLLDGRDDIDNSMVFISSCQPKPGCMEAIKAGLRKYGKFENIIETDIGTTIGGYSGPGTIGIVFAKKV